jgi:hypothetical protein
VTSTPAGISCGSTCAHGFTLGTTVTLSAKPAANSTFAGWTGACTGTSACHVTMSAARSVNAKFALRGKQTLSVTRSGTGTGTVTSSPVGISCGSTCSHAFAWGTAVTLTASATTGSKFAGWSGACTGTTTCHVTMSVARSVKATFTKLFCVVPNVAGKTLAAAKTALANAHCAVGTVTQAASTKVPKGDVISQSPAAGKQLAYGSKVSLVVSSGPPTARPRQHAARAERARRSSRRRR